ncbi:MAG TPA: hypothetical protein VLT79_04020 [Gemmatimonadales bacterium]|nr:hypothetical protein [Gemmatimonadales bacterium]
MTEPKFPDSTPDRRKRSRWIGIGIAIVAVGLTAAGGYLYMRSEARWARDPGHSARTPEDLDKMLTRAEAAEHAGDRDAAIAAYRFVLAVGANGDPMLELYMKAARRGLARLGATPTP